MNASQDVNLSQGTSADPFSHSHTSFAFFRVPFAAWGRRKWLRFSLSVVTILLVALATYATYAVFYAVYHSPVFEPATASAPAADVMRGVNIGGWLVLANSKQVARGQAPTGPDARSITEG